uniref:Uncharacterized protein n=1 Tax=Sphaeramia orbicularis TaxID=375764 RepID=A0A673AH09_9TELE
MSELTDFERGQIVGAHAVGLSVKEIAQLCDVSSQTVLEVLNMYNIPVNNASAEKTSEQRAKKKRKRQKIADANGGANSQAMLLKLRRSVTETVASENTASETPVSENTEIPVTETQFTLTAVSENPDSEVNTQKLDSNQEAVGEKPVSETSNPETPGTETDMTKPEENLRT